MKTKYTIKNIILDIIKLATDNKHRDLEDDDLGYNMPSYKAFVSALDFFTTPDDIHIQVPEPADIGFDPNGDIYIEWDYERKRVYLKFCGVDNGTRFEKFCYVSQKHWEDFNWDGKRKVEEDITLSTLIEKYLE